MDYSQFVKHSCTLGKNDDIVEVNTPPGMFYPLRLWLRRWTMASSTDQISRMLLRSDYQLRLDRKRHYNMYFWTIHPLSDAASFFERFYMVLYFVSVLFYPFTLSFAYETIIYLNLFTDLLFGVKIALAFTQGYVNDKTKEVILDDRMIIKRYLCFYFIVDLLSAFPMNFIVFLGGWHEPVTPILRAIRLLRVASIFKYLRRQHMRHGFPEVISKIVVILLIYFHFIWCTATVILVSSLMRILREDGMEEYENMEYLFTKCLFKGLMFIFHIWTEHEHDKEINVTMYTFICIDWIGFIFKVNIISRVYSIIVATKNTEIKFKNLMNQVKEHAKALNLHPNTKKRLEDYYEFRYQNKFYDEALIDHVLSGHLKKEIKVACARQYVEHVDIFNELPAEIIINICLEFKRDYFLKNDVIMEHGVAFDSLVFITAGTFAVYDQNGKEICHLEDNTYLGEMIMLYNVETNMPTVIAISSCEVFTLKKKTFETIMKKYKTTLKQMYERSNEKLQKTLHVMQRQGYVFIPPQIVVHDCLKSK